MVDPLDSFWPFVQHRNPLGTVQHMPGFRKNAECGRKLTKISGSNWGGRHVLYLKFTQIAFRDAGSISEPEIQGLEKPVNENGKSKSVKIPKHYWFTLWSSINVINIYKLFFSVVFTNLDLDPHVCVVTNKKEHMKQNFLRILWWGITWEHASSERRQAWLPLALQHPSARGSDMFISNQWGTKPRPICFNHWMGIIKHINE